MTTRRSLSCCGFLLLVTLASCSNRVSAGAEQKQRAQNVGTDKPLWRKVGSIDQPLTSGNTFLTTDDRRKLVLIVAGGVTPTIFEFDGASVNKRVSLGEGPRYISTAFYDAPSESVIVFGSSVPAPPRLDVYEWKATG